MPQAHEMPVSSRASAGLIFERFRRKSPHELLRARHMGKASYLRPTI
jgi:hypothetical protein